MDKFYCYIYLDPRKPGRYCYSDMCFLFEPFYVGKGHGKRCFWFLDHNKFCQRKVKKILREIFYEPYMILAKQNISERESLDLEVKFIKEIGRHNLNLGPLTNLTDGGEGLSGFIANDEFKKKSSHPGDTHPMYGKHHSEQTKLKISAAMKGKKKSLDTVEKHRKSMVGKLKGSKHPNFGKVTPDLVKQKISDSNTGKFHSDEWKKNMGLKMKEIWTKRKENADTSQQI